MMIRFKTALYASLSVSALVAVGSPLLAETPAGLSDVVGARGSSAEGLMQQRGWSLIKVEDGPGRKFMNWWHSGQNICVNVVVLDGRYDSIDTVPPFDCGKNGSAANQSYQNRNDDQRYRPPANNYPQPSYPSQGYPKPPYPSQGYPQPGYPSQGYPGYQQPSWNWQSGNLSLVCYGNGYRPYGAVQQGYQWDDRQGRYTPRYMPGQQGFNSEVQVELNGDRGRIHLSGRMKPQINNGGLGGDWWHLKNVRRTRNTITATYKLNFINQPTVVINRRSGSITINGIEKFNGNCDVGNWGGNRPRW